MLKGLTAQFLVTSCYPVKAGDTVLVHAAAGGVGLLLGQWLKALGATAIGTVGSAAKVAIAAGERLLRMSSTIRARTSPLACRRSPRPKGCDVGLRLGRQGHLARLAQGA